MPAVAGRAAGFIAELYYVPAVITDTVSYTHLTLPTNREV